MELETALLDDCNVNDIYAICGGRAIPESLRPDVWQICLDVRYKLDQMAAFNEIYDLPFQHQLRHDCDTVVDKLGNDEDERVSVLSDLESILTFYCKNRTLEYAPQNGWIELLLPLLSLKLSRSYTYNLFESIRDTYIPKGCHRKGNVFHVFRLLILYHDPELCSLLDTKKITPDLYSMSWFQSLFAATCSYGVVLSMWDLYFQQTDPFLVFFLSLIMLINGREQILAMKSDAADTIVQFLQNMPCALEPDDVVDFCALAQYYSDKTPSSFKRDYLKVLFGESGGDGEVAECVVSQALCLPVSVQELVETAAAEMAPAEAVRFFLVDCRPAEQYNCGHLSTAFHLDSNLMLQEPVAFGTAVQGLLRAQRQSIAAHSAAGGEHLCFMGSGRQTEDQYMYMVVASFLQKTTQYVSMLTGGYASIHEYFGEQMADCLEDHSPERCLICNKNNNASSSTPEHAPNNNVVMRKKTTAAAGSSQSTTRAPSDIFSKWSAAMRTKSAEVKGKLIDYIVNPNVPIPAPESPNGQFDRHVSSNERNGKRYRNVAAVFSIGADDDDGGGGQHDENDGYDNRESAAANIKELVQLATYLRHPSVITSYKCQEVHMNGYMYDSQLIVTQSHLVVVRELDKKQGQIIVRRPLSSIVKITAKKRHRDLITFKYGVPDGEALLITDMDRFLIPNASAATALVSKHIVQQLENANATGKNGEET